MIFRSLPGRAARAATKEGSRLSRTGLELEALEDRVLPQSTPTIVVLGLGDPGRVSNLTSPHRGQVNWTAPDLRSAIANAGQTGSTTDTIIVPGGEINLSHGVLEVKAGFNLIVQGGLGASTINAHLRSRILLVDEGSAVTTQNLIFNQGSSHAAGGAIVNDGTLTLLHSQIVNSQVTGAAGPSAVYGGGIDNEGVLTVRDSVVANNFVLGVTLSGGPSQQVFGGGIYSNGTLTVSNSTFSGNQAFGGSNGAPGASYLQGGNASGGAIALAANAVGSASISASTFNNNRVVSGKVSIAASQAFGGFALGGAVFQDVNNAENLVIVNCTFAFNSAQGGSAQAFDNETLGGGAYGGALYLGTHASLINDTVAFNSAVGGLSGGGGVSPVVGGGIYSYTFGQPADTGVRIWNTLVAGNTVDPNPNVFLNSLGYTGIFADDVDGLFSSRGHNLFGILGHATGFGTALHDVFGPQDNTHTGPNGPTPLDPKLDPALRPNGGPTQTLALLAGSLAIDQGDNAVLANPPGVTTDQWGATRPRGSAVDVGAFEFLGFVRPPTGPTIIAGGNAWLKIFKGPQQLVIGSARDLLAATGLNESQLAAILHVPPIDWTTQMIVLVSQGFGAYGASSPTVSITGLTVSINTLTVHWAVGPKPRGIFSLWVTLTDPAAFALVDRFDGVVKFH
jgi:hypothetical protein